jgi:adenylate kinase family enzyme
MPPAASISALVLIGPPGAGKSAVIEALATRLEVEGVEHGAPESEELARGFPALDASGWIAQLELVLERQRAAGRRLFLLAATVEDAEQLRALIAAVGADVTLVVCLAARAEVLAERLGRREPDSWPGKRPLIAHARELAHSVARLDGVEVMIDTNEREANDVATQIHGEMQARGLLASEPEH